MGEKNYFIDLPGLNSCRIRVSIKTEQGRVIDLVIQLEVWERNEWHPVARYDCAHDQPHIDLVLKGGRQEKKFMETGDLKEVVNNAINDFKENWQNYLRRSGYGQEEE